MRGCLRCLDFCHDASRGERKDAEGAVQRALPLVEQNVQVAQAAHKQRQDTLLIKAHPADAKDESSKGFIL